MNIFNKLGWGARPGYGPSAGDGPDFEGTPGDALPNYRGQAVQNLRAARPIHPTRGNATWGLFDAGQPGSAIEIGSWIAAMSLIAFGLFVLLLIILGH
jgi:hypothetical protein